ncbi:uncharacterized protein CMU_007340 [Cryptosporidium muris RN66]|uniref:Uncharacterized protein n=1 Tax=Cryptosporidium muris (strain RN66) TaxID=441375 RepID=B6ADF4_CRYMR|nr:uncharacterized protein CMU_007340 [Cryptosporidium muris RN66]EEA06245.1 hypothetical protein, conserved [Cryptosporidium muris RN66]|eukprot:XP_002140594.1 hypothetical protein [Cryptosporidium muris RN66]
MVYISLLLYYVVYISVIIFNIGNILLKIQNIANSLPVQKSRNHEDISPKSLNWTNNYSGSHFSPVISQNYSSYYPFDIINNQTSETAIQELNLEVQCNRLWLLQALIQQSLLSIGNFKINIPILRHESNVSLQNDWSQIFRTSLDAFSRHRNKLNETLHHFDSVILAGKHYGYLTNSHNKEYFVLLIPYKSPVFSQIQQFTEVYKGLTEYISHTKYCSSYSPNITKGFVDSLNALYMFSILTGKSSIGINSQYLERFSKESSILHSIEKKVPLSKLLISFQNHCRNGMDTPSKNNNTFKKWSENKLRKVTASITQIENLAKQYRKKVELFLNCINYFENVNDILSLAENTFESIGVEIQKHIANRKEILSLFIAKYNATVIESSITNNRSYSLWLQIQQLLLTIRVAISGILMNKNKRSFKKLGNNLSYSLSVSANCSHVLRYTATNWNLIFSIKNRDIIERIKNYILVNLNNLTYTGDQSYQTEWHWTIQNEYIIKTYANSFNNMWKREIHDPLVECAKPLKMVYKQINLQHTKNNESNTIESYKNYIGTLVPFIKRVINRQKQNYDRFSSLKSLFVWPHIIVSLESAISIFNRTCILEEAICQSNQNFVITQKSRLIWLQRLQSLSNTLKEVYKHICERSYWDLLYSYSNFGYFNSTNIRSIDKSNFNLDPENILRKPNSTPVQVGTWILKSLEISQLYNLQKSDFLSIVEPGLHFRLQFLENWIYVLEISIKHIINPIALQINSFAETILFQSLQYQTQLASKPINSTLNNMNNISSYVEQINTVLNSLYRESSCIEVQNNTSSKNSYSTRYSGDFPSFLSIQNYVEDLLKRVTELSTEVNNKLNNLSSDNQLYNRNCRYLLYYTRSAKEELLSKSQILKKIYTDLTLQRAEMMKLFAIVEECLKYNEVNKRAECWITNQWLELPLKRTIEVRKIMTQYLQSIIDGILNITNFVEDCLSSILNPVNQNRRLLKVNKSDSDQQGYTGYITLLNVLVKPVDNMLNSLNEELYTLEVRYPNEYRKQINGIYKDLETVSFEFLKLKSLKSTIVHYYGKPNWFQKIFKFPKVILRREKVAELDSLLLGYNTSLNNESLYALEVIDYTKENLNGTIISCNNIKKYYDALLGAKNRLRCIIGKSGQKLDKSKKINETLGNGTMIISNFKKLSILTNLRGLKNLENNISLLLKQSQKVLNQVNIEHYRFFTVRNETTNMKNRLSKIIVEIVNSQKYIEDLERNLANSNCFRLWKWKRRTKSRQKKTNKKQVKGNLDKLRKLTTIHNSNKKLSNGIPVKTIKLDFKSKISELTSQASKDVYISSETSTIDVDSFQFDDLYKFDDLPDLYNPKKSGNIEDISYDTDLGGKTDYGEQRYMSKFTEKVNKAIQMGISIGNIIRDFHAIRKTIFQNNTVGESSTMFMAGLNILNALTSGNINEGKSLFNDAQDTDLATQIFNEADIFKELNTGDNPLQVDFNFNDSYSNHELPLEVDELDPSYKEFKEKIINQLQNKGYDLDSEPEHEDYTESLDLDDKYF